MQMAPNFFWERRSATLGRRLRGATIDYGRRREPIDGLLRDAKMGAQALRLPVGHPSGGLIALVLRSLTGEDGVNAAIGCPSRRDGRVAERESAGFDPGAGTGFQITHKLHGYVLAEADTLVVRADLRIGPVLSMKGWDGCAVAFATALSQVRRRGGSRSACAGHLYLQRGWRRPGSRKSDHPI